MNQQIYYLPGQGGSLHKGLGEALIQRGYEPIGRELQGAFRNLDFGEKVATISKDLQSLQQIDGLRIIANSFGAYLLLHALAEIPPYTGRLLLLSPIVGGFSNEGVGIGFIPPRAKRLLEMAKAESYPTPTNCEIHVGSEDWQCNPENVSKFGALIGVPVHIVPQGGHLLDHAYVSQVLDIFLS